MTTQSPAMPQTPAPRLPPPCPPYAAARPQGNLFLAGLHRTLLLLAGLLSVILIALLDYQTESHLSFSIFYLAPVAACAWCGGFSHGTLVSLGASAAWHSTDLYEDPALPAAVRLWNMVIRFGCLVLISSLVARLHAGILRERRLARTDALTGAANGRTFYETAAVEADRARRSARPLTLAYFDLDNFKQLNDRQGHAAGDAALQAVVQTIQLHLRGSDLLARLGGDEFALLLPETDAEGAATLLARLQERLAQEMARKGWPVGVSIGAVTFPLPRWDVDLMIQRVDALMYSAKKKGKGRVEHAVVQDAEGPEDASRPGVERRATARLLCNRTARVRRQGEEERPEEFAVIRDLSVAGIGLYMDQRLPEGVLVLVEPLSPGARTLLARVKYTTPEGGGWRHGCQLPTPLNAEELCCWLGEHLESACH